MNFQSLLFSFCLCLDLQWQWVHLGIQIILLQINHKCLSNSPLWSEGILICSEVKQKHLCFAAENWKNFLLISKAYFFQSSEAKRLSFDIRNKFFQFSAAKLGQAHYCWWHLEIQTSPLWIHTYTKRKQVWKFILATLKRFMLLCWMSSRS